MTISFSVNVQCLVSGQGGLIVTMTQATLNGGGITYSGVPYLIDTTDANLVTASTACAKAGWVLDFSAETYDASSKPTCADFTVSIQQSHKYAVSTNSVVTGM